MSKPITRPEGSATVKDMVDVYTSLDWGSPGFERLWRHALRRVRSRIYGVEATDHWFYKRYDIAEWWRWRIGPIGKPACH